MDRYSHEKISTCLIFTPIPTDPNRLSGTLNFLETDSQNTLIGIADSNGRFLVFLMYGGPGINLAFCGRINAHKFTVK